MGKRMTQKQKTERARIRKELQEQGILPPDKPRLNRKKFIEEAKEEWNARDSSCLTWDLYLYWAIAEMLSKRDKNLHPSLEAVGVAKVLKLALRKREFMEKLRSEGKDKYKTGDLIDYVMDIYEA